MSSYGADLYNGKYLLTKSERVMIMIVSIWAIVAGVIADVIYFVSLADFIDKHPNLNITGLNNHEDFINLGFIIGMIGMIIRSVCFSVMGIFGLLNHRWAFIVLEVLMIGSCLGTLNGIMAPESVLSSLLSFLILGVDIAITVFVHKCQDSLSGFSQSTRKSYYAKHMA